MKYKLGKGGDPNFIIRPYSFSPLYLAAQRGLIETARILIQANADVNFKDEQGRTPLYAAVNKQALLNMLLDENPDVTTVDKSGVNFLQMYFQYTIQAESKTPNVFNLFSLPMSLQADNSQAYKKTYSDIVKRLISAGARMPANSRDTQYILKHLHESSWEEMESLAKSAIN